MIRHLVLMCLTIASINAVSIPDISTMTPTEIDPATIPDDEYVTVKDGHLSLGGERVRYWGHIGHFPNPKFKDGRNPRRDAELQVERMLDLGFNLHRLWIKPDGADYEIGDGSRDDLIDYSLFLLKENGIKVWFSCLNRCGVVNDEDVNIIDDPATAEAWVTAINENKRTHWWSKGEQVYDLNKYHLARQWDPRLKALALKRYEQIATHRNKYTGLRYCDDPNFVVWELVNEEWWMSRMMAGDWQKEPDFFRTSLIAKWHEYLTNKYGDNAGVAKAWHFLLPGESLDETTIMLAPMRNSSEAARLSDPNSHAAAALEGIDSDYGREDFADQRGADVIEFFMGILLESKREQMAFVKPLGKSTQFAPLLFDTGIGSQIQSQYLHQCSEAVTHCTYINGQHHDPQHKRFPFNSALDEQPRMCWDTPWLEHNRAPDMPFFVYEIQIKATTKYRAEFPMQVASLGAIQDWDIVNWHSYGPGPDSRLGDTPNTRALEVGHSLDLHFGGDEVQLSSMRAASEIFCHGHLQSAPEPTLWVFGEKGLYAPSSMDYSGSYLGEMPKFMPTTYRHGMRLLIDPTLDDQPDHPLFHGKDGKPDPKKHAAFMKKGFMVKGKVVKPRVFESCPIQPTEEISYDWHQSHLRFDAPGVAMFTGFHGELLNPDATLSFNTGVQLRDLSFHNPEGMPYPVTDEEGYLTFALVSADGKPLESCSEAVISLVSTSFNTGYKMKDLTENPNPREFKGVGMASAGELPVLVTRISGTVLAPAINGMSYTFHDWEMNTIGEGQVADGALRIPGDLPVFYVTLKR